jgi:hypothetical protein
MEGYTGPRHNGDGTSPVNPDRSSTPEETAGIGHDPAVPSYQQPAEDAARAARIAGAREDFARSLIEGMIRQRRLRPSEPLSTQDARRIAHDALEAVMVHVTNPQVVTDEFREQLITQIVSDLKGCWNKPRPVDTPAPAGNGAETAIALKLRALVRQHSRRGPPKEESDNDDPAAVGLRQVLDLCRRSTVAVYRRLSGDRATRGRT